MKPGIPSQQREVLRTERLLHHWSQRDVAERIGVTVVTISRWERGIHAPGPYFRLRLCALFHKEATDLGLFSPELTKIGEELQDQSFLCDPMVPCLENGQSQTPLVGRAEAIREIVEQFCVFHRTAYALVGIPGVGKTSLASLWRFTSRCASSFPTVFCGPGWVQRHR